MLSGDMVDRLLEDSRVKLATVIIVIVFVWRYAVFDTQWRAATMHTIDKIEMQQLHRDDVVEIVSTSAPWLADRREIEKRIFVLETKLDAIRDSDL